MSTYANLNLPFLGGGPTIAEQILQGLHEGATEKLQQQQLGLEKQRVGNETNRSNVLNRLTEAQIQHEANVTSFEKETNPIKRSQLLNDLQESAAKLAMLKHQLSYFGLDADAITKSVTPEGIAPPAQKAAGTSAAPAGPTPFEQDMQKTEKLLGALTPEEQAIWENGKSVAMRSMSAAPIQAAIGKISENRQAIHKAELETTPFKDWKAQFTKEHGRVHQRSRIQSGSVVRRFRLYDKPAPLLRVAADRQLLLTEHVLVALLAVSVLKRRSLALDGRRDGDLRSLHWRRVFFACRCGENESRGGDPATGVGPEGD